jgi:hypothetical protein
MLPIWETIQQMPSFKSRTRRRTYGRYYFNGKAQREPPGPSLPNPNLIPESDQSKSQGLLLPRLGRPLGTIIHPRPLTNSFRARFLRIGRLRLFKTAQLGRHANASCVRHGSNVTCLCPRRDITAVLRRKRMFHTGISTLEPLLPTWPCAAFA